MEKARTRGEDNYLSKYTKINLQNFRVGEKK